MPEISIAALTAQHHTCWDEVECCHTAERELATSSSHVDQKIYFKIKLNILPAGIFFKKTLIYYTLLKIYGLVLSIICQLEKT